eukprot:4498106-Amphidinium_carterae.7
MDVCEMIRWHMKESYSWIMCSSHSMGVHSSAVQAMLHAIPNGFSEYDDPIGTSCSWRPHRPHSRHYANGCGHDGGLHSALS